MLNRGNDAGENLLSCYGPPIMTYRGDEGILILKDGKIVGCTYKVGQLSNGDILLLCQIPTHGELPAEGFEGKTSDGYRIYSSKVIGESNYLPDDTTVPAPGTGIAFRLSELHVQVVEGVRAQKAHFGLTNFLFQLPGINCQNNGVQLSITPVKEYYRIRQRLQTLKSIDVTGEVAGALSEDTSIAQLQESVDALCHILSVARGTKIQWIYCYEFDSADNCISRIHFSRDTTPYCPLAVIDHQNNIDTQRFIESTYGVYVSKKDVYKLDKGVIDAYLDAKSESDHAQIRGAKLAVALEMLKATFLEVPTTDLREYIVAETQFKKIADDIKKLLKDSVNNPGHRKALYGNLRELNRTPFKELLGSIFKQIALDVDDNDLERFVKSRNYLVHTGRFYCEAAQPKEREKLEPLPSVQDEFFSLVHFLDRIFLKLLGYGGPYIDWGSQGGPVRRDQVNQRPLS